MKKRLIRGDGRTDIDGFPHHAAEAKGEGSPDLATCRAGIAILNGGRGGADIAEADRKGIYEHLAAHLKQLGETPADLVSPLEALRNMGTRAIARLGESMAKLKEAGRVLSAANEAKLQQAAQSIQDVLSQLDTAADDGNVDEAKRKMREGSRKLAEAWSEAAWDASAGAWLLAELIGIMGDESDEPEQYAMLKAAFDALSEWIAAEVDEIGGNADEVVDLPLFGYEARRPHQVKEAIGPVIPIKEGAVRSDGTVRLKVIQPGWGSSGYYSAEVLERDGAAAFPAGTKNFWDHPTSSEEVERPERSLRDLAGETTSDVVFEADGPEGAGLYADAQVRSDFAPAVNEMAPWIGVSIRALGTGHYGEAEGRSGLIIDRLIAGESIDYVTTPGAGGRVMQIFEAHRPKPISNSPQEVPDDMDPQKLQEAQAQIAERDREIARLREVTLVRDAKEHAAVKLAEVEGLPQVTRSRLSESLSKAAKADKEGKLDIANLEEAIEAAVKSEIDYLTKATGGGQVLGFGSSTKTEIDHEKELAEVLQGAGIGLTETAAKRAAKGRG